MKILFNGRSGKVGVAVAPLLEAAGHTLVESLDDAEAMVDFTKPDAVADNLRAAIAAGVPCVVGTSGWETSAFRDAPVTVFYAPNFALGAVLMMRFAAEAARSFEAAEIVELGCGLGVPSLVAAARGAEVTAVDWAEDAVVLLRRNAAANELELRAERRDWREPWSSHFDLAIAADVLYELRNVEPVLERLRELAPVAFVALAARPFEDAFLRLAGPVEEIAPRVVRLTS